MSEKDVLISRIVDREDCPEDWARLDAIAGADQRVYAALVATLRDESLLRRAVEPQLAVVDRVELRAPGFLARHPWLPQWSGWLTVASLLLVWLAMDPRAPEPSLRSSPSGSEVAQATPDLEMEPSAPAAELATTRVLRVLPNLMVETRPIAGSDQTEVIYVRRTLERAVIGQAYTLARDEIGQPIQASVDLSRFTPRRSY